LVAPGLARGVLPGSAVLPSGMTFRASRIALLLLLVTALGPAFALDWTSFGDLDDGLRRVVSCVDGPSGARVILG
jgi:hypothetical protein